MDKAITETTEDLGIRHGSRGEAVLWHTAFGTRHVLAWQSLHTAAVDMQAQDLYTTAPATIMLWGRGREVLLRPQPSPMSYWQETVVIFFIGVATAKFPMYQ